MTKPILDEIALYIFDMDGTLVDSIDRRVDAGRIMLAELAKKRLIRCINDEDAGFIAEHSMKSASKRFGILPEEEMQAIYDRAYKQSHEAVGVFDGAVESIAELKKRRKLVACITGASKYAATYNLGILQEAYAEKNKKGGVFHAFLYYKRDGPKKPDPLVIHELGKRLGERGYRQAIPLQTAVIGDTESDCKFAENIMAYFIYISGNVAEIEVARRSNIVVPNMQAFYKLLNR